MTAATKKPKGEHLNVIVGVRRQEPQGSICLGYEGLSGTYKGIEFTSTVDVMGRGIMVSYKRKNGVSGCFSLNFSDLVKACLEAPS